MKCINFDKSQYIKYMASLISNLDDDGSVCVLYLVKGHHISTIIKTNLQNFTVSHTQSTFNYN